VTSAALIEAAKTIEPVVAAVVAVILLALGVRRLATGAPATVTSLDAPIARRTELALVAIVVTIALAVRVVGWDAAWTPAFWFSETSTLFVDRWMRVGALWSHWMDELKSTAVLHPHDAAMVLPVLAGLQSLLGPRFGLPVLSGALFGTLSVVLGWALGRRMRSAAFGLVFAALLACSPLQVTWARLSGFIVAAAAHVLLGLLVGFQCGRRGSVLLALVAGLVAWTSVYHYYPARVSLVLVPLAIVAGGLAARRTRRAVLLAVLATAACAGFGWLALDAASVRALWPSYGGYAGNMGERTLGEFVTRNLASFRVELGHAIARYFVERRVGWSGSSAFVAGMAQGGLTPAPIALLGLVGLVAAVRRWREQWLWFAVAAAGLALPAISVMSARRIVVFDVAWCAFAAHGCLAVVDWLGARLARAARAWLAAGVVGLTGAWSVATVFLLSAALPAGFAQQIPFADAGFGDGIACRRCLDAAKEWAHEIRDGAFVVLFDNDIFRENRTSPGGLPSYGKIAALVAGRPAAFVEGYALMAGYDPEPPGPALLFDVSGRSFVDYLESGLENTTPTPSRIVWQFERPTSWERWLAGRLANAGGAREEFSTPLSLRPGIRVTTPWARRAEAFDVLRALVTVDAPGSRGCFTLLERQSLAASTPVWALAALPAGDTPPEWVTASFDTQRYRGLAVETPQPLAASVGRGPRGAETMRFFLEDGREVAFAVPSLRRSELPPPGRGPFGLNCAARAAGHWWVVDPWTGAVSGTHPSVAAAPRGEWIGVTTDAAGQLVLASGDQQIVVWDPETRTEIVRFPARVGPSVRWRTDECTPIAAGEDWIATLDLRTTVVSLYDRNGRDLGARRLSRMPGSPPITTIAGAGRWLGVAFGPMVRSFDVRIEPDCAAIGDARR
jgi:hypothetical protein